MPEKPVKYYQVGENRYKIPIDIVEEFLTDNPNAIEQLQFVVGKDTFALPPDVVDSFLKDNPDAKPLEFEDVRLRELIEELIEKQELLHPTIQNLLNMNVSGLCGAHARILLIYQWSLLELTRIVLYHLCIRK